MSLPFSAILRGRLADGVAGLTAARRFGLSDPDRRAVEGAGQDNKI